MKITKLLLNILILSVLIINISSGNSLYINSHINKDIKNEIVNFENYSFHGNTSIENGNWYIIKFSSNETIYIDETYIHLSYNVNEKTRWGYAHRIFFTNLSATFPISMPFMNKISHPFDRYTQVNFGLINFSKNYLQNKPSISRTERLRFSDITLPNGTWYLVSFAAPSNTCEIEVFINNTNAENFNSTEGSSCFLYENEDFNCIINIKTVPISCMIKGEKNIKINDTFIGFFYTFLSNGFTRVQYTSPNGKTKESKVTYFNNKLNIIDGSEFNPILDAISESNGIWKFEVDMSGMFLSTVNVFGADVKLPE